MADQWTMPKAADVEADRERCARRIKGLRAILGVVKEIEAEPAAERGMTLSATLSNLPISPEIVAEIEHNQAERDRLLPVLRAAEKYHGKAE